MIEKNEIEKGVIEGMMEDNEEKKKEIRKRINNGEDVEKKDDLDRIKD